MPSCRNCKVPTTNRIGLRILCSISCAVTFGKSEAERKQLKQKAEIRRNERKADKAAKERIKPLTAWLAEAQSVFNAYIRERDAALPCISCGVTRAGQWDCSHYRSRAAASHLRFSEANCHRACSVCNQHFSGRIVDYRIGLIRKIGMEAVELLEHDNRPHKWTIEEAKEIKVLYRQKLKELKSAAELA